MRNPNMWNIFITVNQRATRMKMWNSCVMRYICYEIYMLWDIYLMRYICYDICYEIYMLWDIYVMRYICYEIYMLRIFHVSLVEVNLRPFSAVCKIVDVKVFENTNPSKVLNWSQQNVFKTRVTIGEYSLLLFLVICHSLKSEPFVNTGSFGTANFKVLPPPPRPTHTQTTNTGTDLNWFQ